MLRSRKLYSFLGLTLSYRISAQLRFPTRFRRVLRLRRSQPAGPILAGGRSRLRQGRAANESAHRFLGPNSYDPKAERDALDQAVQKKATGILLGGNRSCFAEGQHRQGHRRGNSGDHHGFRRARQQAAVLHRHE